MKKIIFSGLVVTVFITLVAGGAWAKMGGIPGRVEALEAAVADLQTAVKDLEAANAAQQTEIANLRADLTMAQETIVALQTENAAQQVQLDALASLQELASFVTVETEEIHGLAAPHVVFTGANVHIRSGFGSTDDGGDLSGLGNLIVGYNGPRALNVRSGSHNIVLGDLQNFSAFGGLVAGRQNTIEGEYATVTGGHGNYASDYAAHVSGGWVNRASFAYTSVSGGVLNEASGWYSSVSGGYGNTASGDYSSVSGGNSISISGDYDWAASSLVDTLTALTINKSGTVSITSSGGNMNLKGNIITLNDGNRPVSGIGDYDSNSQPLITGATSVLIP